MNNVTQGILGFAVTACYLRMQKTKMAVGQCLGAHAAMLFILVFGWDGSGYRRFFYAGTGDQWHQGIEFPLSAFWQSSIFLAY